MARVQGPAIGNQETAGAFRLAEGNFVTHKPPIISDPDAGIAAALIATLAFATGCAFLSILVG